MDKESRNILILKTSALGDIFQALPVLSLFENQTVDWLVKPQYTGAVERLVHTVYTTDHLPKKRYDAILDLQGNCRTGALLLRLRARDKIGFAASSVPEWPNLLCTNRRYPVDLSLPITEQYVSLVRSHLNTDRPLSPITYPLTPAEREEVASLVAGMPRPLRMVCPLSNWENKEIDPKTLVQYLQTLSGSFLFITPGRPLLGEALVRAFPSSQRLGMVPIPLWYHLMQVVDEVISVDSSALHLAALTQTPTLSFFGPSSQTVYAPKGPHHRVITGPCPYSQTFVKRCKKLRTCLTGACLKRL